MNNYLLILIVILGVACTGCVYLIYRYRQLCKLYNNVQGGKHKLVDDIQNLQRSLFRMQASEKEKDNLISVLEQKDKYTYSLLTHYKSNIIELKSADANKQRIIDEMQQRISALETEITNKTENINDSLHQIHKLNWEIDEKDKRISELEQVIQEQSNKPVESIPSQQTENETDELLDQIDILKRHNEELDVKNTKLKNETDELKGKLANKESTIRIKDDRIKELEQKLGVEPIIVEEAQINPVPTTPIQQEGDGDIDQTKRTIDTVVDVETGKEIFADDFFSQSESAIFKMRTELQKAIYLRHPKYVCKYCGQMVKISGRKREKGAATFFSHLRDSDDCEYKTTTGRTKRETP